MQQIVVIGHNIRSSHNVGSLLRTAEGLGVDTVYLTGYTPYPLLRNDERLPHLAIKISNQIAKTALGAERYIQWRHSDSINQVITDLRKQSFTIVGLEQAPHSIPLPEFTQSGNIALILGSEVEGMNQELLTLCDIITEIPMFGKKESFNVVQAAAMALYQFRFYRND